MSDYRKQIVDELRKKPVYTADVTDYGQHPLIRDQERRGMPQAELSGYRPSVVDWAKDTFGGENVQRVIKDRLQNPGKIISAPIVAAMGLVDGAKSAADGVKYFLNPQTAPHPTDTRADAMSARRASDVAGMVGTGSIGTTATAAAVGRPMVPRNALGTLISSKQAKNLVDDGLRKDGDWGTPQTLREAEEQWKAGVDPDQTFSELGWSNRAYGDAMPAYTAIDDQQIVRNPKRPFYLSFNNGPLYGEYGFFRHPEYESAIKNRDLPEHVREIAIPGVEFDNTLSKNSAYLEPDTNTIGIPGRHRFFGFDETDMSSLVHEGQHAMAMRAKNLGNWSDDLSGSSMGSSRPIKAPINDVYATALGMLQSGKSKSEVSSYLSKALKGTGAEFHKTFNKQNPLNEPNLKFILDSVGDFTAYLNNRGEKIARGEQDFYRKKIDYKTPRSYETTNTYQDYGDPNKMYELFTPKKK